MTVQNKERLKLILMAVVATVILFMAILAPVLWR